MIEQTNNERNRISALGAVVLIMAMISLTVVLWTSYQERQITECQKVLNSQFLTALKGRANIADGDREAVRTLVDQLVESQTEAGDLRALEEYDRANSALDRLREKIQYPADTELCN